MKKIKREQIKIIGINRSELRDFEWNVILIYANYGDKTGSDYIHRFGNRINYTWQIIDKKDKANKLINFAFFIQTIPNKYKIILRIIILIVGSILTVLIIK